MAARCARPADRRSRGGYPEPPECVRSQIGRASCRERGWRWGVAGAGQTDVWNRRRAELLLLQAEDGIRDRDVTGVQTCALPIYAEADIAEHRDIRLIVEVDLLELDLPFEWRRGARARQIDDLAVGIQNLPNAFEARSEERRVGKEGGAGGSRGQGRQTSGIGGVRSFCCCKQKTAYEIVM